MSTGTPMTRLSSFRVSTLGLLALTLCHLLPTSAAAQAASSSPAPALQGESCSVQGLMDSIRRGLGSKSEAYKRYLEGWFRERLGLAGTPLRIELRSGANPFAPRRAGQPTR